MHRDSWGGGTTGCFLVVVIVVIHTWTAVAAPLSYRRMVKLMTSGSTAGQHQPDSRLTTFAGLLHRLRFRDGPGIEAERQRQRRSLSTPPPTSVICMSLKRYLRLAIDPNGVVYGTNDGQDSNSLLVRESEDLSRIRIRGLASNRYITVTPDGYITSTTAGDVASSFLEDQCGSQTSNCTHAAYPNMFKSLSPGSGHGKYLAMHRSGEVILKKNPRDAGGASVYFKCY